MKSIGPFRRYQIATFLLAYAVVEGFRIATDVSVNLVIAVVAVFWWLGFFAFRHRWPEAAKSPDLPTVEATPSSNESHDPA